VTWLYTIGNTPGSERNFEGKTVLRSIENEFREIGSFSLNAKSCGETI
jgi:hypothetical protein